MWDNIIYVVMWVNIFLINYFRFPPFNGSNNFNILKKIEEGYFQMTSPEWEYISDYAKDIVKKMLTYSPSRRPSA